MYLALYVLSCECNDVKRRAGLYIQPAGSASKLGKLWFVYVAASLIPRVALGGLYHVFHMGYALVCGDNGERQL